MHLPRSYASHSIIQLDEAGSTNDELIHGRPDAPDFTVVVTASQTAGRGRLGRKWVAPPGKTLAISVLLRPVLPTGRPLPLEAFGWLPLIAGLAMAKSVAALVPADVVPAAVVPADVVPSVGLKWPNDVQVDGRKVSGVLAELLPAGDAVVIGAGLNLFLTEDELPVPTATSLVLAGAGQRGADQRGAGQRGDELADLALSAYLDGLRAGVARYLGAGGDAAAAGILPEVSELCTTIGQDVRVQLPGAADLLGRAVGLDRAGRLVVRRLEDGELQAVAAGDVTHLRYE